VVRGHNCRPAGRLGHDLLTGYDRCHVAGSFKSRNAVTTGGDSLAILVAMAPPTLAPDLDSFPPTAMKATITRLPLRTNLRLPPASEARLPCQEENPALWFSNAPAELNRAKAFCHGCRNRHPCLAGALERAEPAGVWGGEIFEQGRIVEFKRPRGRPRKSPRPDDERLIPPAFLPAGG